MVRVLTLNLQFYDFFVFPAQGPFLVFEDPIHISKGICCILLVNHPLYLLQRAYRLRDVLLILNRVTYTGPTVPKIHR